MRGCYKYKTHKYDEWLKKDKFVHCGDVIEQSCGFTGHQKYTIKQPADIIGFVNQFRVMVWRKLAYARTRPHARDAERLSVCHVFPFQLVKWSCALCHHLPQMMSHLLLQQLGDDLTDSVSHRQMTSAMTVYQALSSLAAFVLCFSLFKLL